tara:strand:+ start:335 stop:535 length:201 start_codon:yes stop_codon:yes gene_type:complete
VAKPYFTYEQVKKHYFNESSDIALATQDQIDRLERELDRHPDYESSSVQCHYDMALEELDFLIAEF